jgi:hypothetical protein
LTRHTIIFGNGLGRALNNDFFQLQAAMREVWQDPGALSDMQRQLISTAIEGIDADGPTEEDQLLGTQLALMACRLLSSAVRDDSLEHWLTAEAMSFPAALQKYTYMVAKYFHRFDADSAINSLWSDFIDHLVLFISDSKSHVATLNYDTLLYQPFNEARTVGGRAIQLCSGFNGVLLDGYTRGLGFSEQNLERQRPNDQAFYMHLHGSPLFIDNDDGLAHKLSRPQLQEQGGEARSHIVLTNGTMKSRVIQGSKVLQMYWDHLPQAIEDSDALVVFGYSGADSHLNKLIRKNVEKRAIRVIERTHAPDINREQYWQNLLGPTTQVLSFENILEFTEW